MKVNLQDIKEELKKYANTISKLFSMDVGICDKNLVRITGRDRKSVV